MTGNRAAIAKAVSLTDHPDDIVEAISAEDLGKLPDLDIAAGWLGCRVWPHSGPKAPQTSSRSGVST